MKNNLHALYFSPCIFLIFISPCFCLGFQSAINQKSIIDDAYQSYLQGELTRPSSQFFEASEVAAAEQKKNPSAQLKAKQIILTAYGYYIATYYEYSLILPQKEKQELFLKQIQLLQDSDDNMLSNEMKAAIHNASGLLYELLKMYLKADQSFIEALKYEPEWPVLLSNHGDILYYLGDYEGSELLFERAIELDPKLLKAYYFLGWSYYVVNEENKALALGSKALEINPDFFLIHNLFAKIYSELGNSERAMEEYLKLLEINPNWVVAYTNIANDFIYTTKEYTKAIKWSKKAIAIDPNYSQAYKGIGDSYDKLKKRDSAYYYFNLCNQIDSTCYTSIGWLDYNAKDYDRAFENAMIEIKKDSINADAYNLAAWSKYHQKDYKNSVELFKRSTALNSLSTGSFLGLAYSYSELKEYEKAGDAWEKLIKLSPSVQSYVYRIGYDFINIAKQAMEEDRKDDALKWLLRGSDLGNKFCRLFASGLMNEYGINVPANYALAMESYKKGARRINFMWFLQKRIVSLYEENKVAMDSTDYDFWKNKIPDNKEMKRFTIPCDTKSGGKIRYDVFILPHYPKNVHPLEWEAERLMEEEGAKIPDAVMDSFQKLMLLAIKNDVSFPDLCVYALDAANEKEDNAKAQELNALIKSDTVSKVVRNTTHLELLDFYKKKYEKDSTETALSLYLNASDDYLTYLNSNNENDKAEEFLVQNKNLLKKDIPFIKFFHFKTGKDSGIDLFKELYLSERDTLLADDIDYFIKKIQGEKEKEDKLFLYNYLLRLDDNLLKTSSDSTSIKKVAQHYNSTAWYQLLTGKFAESELTVRKGLMLDPDYLYFYTNLPAALLLQGKYEKAYELYKKWRDRPFDPEAGYSTFKEAFLDDFKTFEKEKIIPLKYEMDVEKIKNLLNN